MIKKIFGSILKRTKQKAICSYFNEVLINFQYIILRVKVFFLKLNLNIALSAKQQSSIFMIKVDGIMSLRVCHRKVNCILSGVVISYCADVSRFVVLMCVVATCRARLLAIVFCCGHCDFVARNRVPSFFVALFSSYNIGDL